MRNPVVASLSAGVAILILGIGLSVFVGARASELQRLRAERAFFWVLQGVTDPLKALANPDLAKNPVSAKSRRQVITHAIMGYKEYLAYRGDAPDKWGENTSIYIHIGLLYTVLDDRPRAAEAYIQAVEYANKALQAFPASGNAWRDLGMTNYHAGMELWYEGRRDSATAYLKNAADAFERALEHDSDNIPILQHYAWFLTTVPDPRLRNAEKAVRLAKRLVELASPLDYDRTRFSGGIRPLFTLGLAQYRSGDNQAALRTLEQSCAKRDGGDAYEWFILAMVHARLGDAKRALELHDRARTWTRENRYGDFELHFFDEEAIAILPFDSSRLQMREAATENRHSAR